ncbi:STAS domain-containing protein [Kitasatospora sp. DSM 101779]|uniref:STAS domain-containing protein n=1 Tax=Kitasatospora sp. DSM 101779 TaxID=2853165 RepID=UPI0021D8347A|nr:STAS domain-containing protein [Kitasatospora sp. DSM 101779]MCU7826590.1 STAS domain-containing protein [Kitasatospora sp. DSM 101779]
MGTGDTDQATGTATDTGVRTTVAAAFDGALVCAVEGDLDLDGAHAARPDLEAALDAAAAALCLDLGGVGFCDSSGLNLLLRLRSRARERGVRLVLSSLPPQTKRLLDMTGADTVFTVFGSAAEFRAGGSERRP